MGIFKRKKKDVARCPNCRKPVPDGTVFCESCGLRQLPPPACAKCGILLAPDTNFCESCGTPVGPIQSGAAPPEPASIGGGAPQPDLPKRSPKGRKKKKNSPEPKISLNEGTGEPAPEDPCIPKATSVQEDKGSQGSVIPPVPATRCTRSVSFHPGRAVIICLLLAGIVLAFGIFPGTIPSFSLPKSDGPSSPAAVPVSPSSKDPTGASSTVPSVLQEIAEPSLIPRPTIVPPDSYSVWFQAVRDPVTHNVTVMFDGGKGQRGVRDVLVRLTRSDGKVLMATFQPVAIGEGVTLPGTKYTDRLEVVVSYNSGEQFPVIDKLFEHKERN